jgi:hypothetical protein
MIELIAQLVAWGIIIGVTAGILLQFTAFRRKGGCNHAYCEGPELVFSTALTCSEHDSRTEA